MCCDLLYPAAPVQLCSDRLCCDMMCPDMAHCTLLYLYSIWCFHHIMEYASKENLPGRCPNCRTTYDAGSITMERISPDECVLPPESASAAIARCCSPQTMCVCPAVLSELRAVWFVPKRLALLTSQGILLEACRDGCSRPQVHDCSLEKSVRKQKRRSKGRATINGHGSAGDLDPQASIQLNVRY